MDKNMFKCDICGKEFEQYSAMGGHKSSAHNLEKAKKVSEALTLKKVLIKKNCKKCGKEFEIERKIKKDGSFSSKKSDRDFCSRACANSKVHSIETLRKISENANPWNRDKKTIKPDRFCNCGRKICDGSKTGICLKCTFSSKEYREKKSLSMKLLYINGKEVCGGTTKWFCYKDFKVQGTYELRTCKILDKMLEIGEIDFWEKTKYRIKYVGEDSKEHSYLIDFKVTYRDKTYYIETKGYKTKKDELKWRRAEELELDLRKWFKKDIEKEEERLNLF